jgi:hypothetical protein
MAWRAVAEVDAIGRNEFFGEFVRGRRPVRIRGLMRGWKARQWDGDYLRRRVGGLRLAVKSGYVADGVRQTIALTDYIDSVVAYEDGLRRGLAPKWPGYLHDVPIFHHAPELGDDVEPFPLHLFPRWYWPHWPTYVQFFMGPTGSVTPLHFDTLCTHNLFFQVVGRKRFTLVPAEQKKYCYLDGWRWARFDPSDPDLHEFPLAARTTPVPVVLEPGDVLYIPPGTLHHVVGLSSSISFNIDWHTARSALRGLTTVFRGAPLKNGYYNALCLLGLGLGVPARYVLPLYRSYLEYVS